ncbi:MAG: ABC transporter ATP-binding protein [Sphaerochaetaceae bacterium]
MSLLDKIQHKYALSEKGAKDFVKSCASCALADFVLMMPVGLLYYLVGNLMNGEALSRHALFYIVGITISLLLIFLTSRIQYTSCYFATYVESGVRRITLAEKLRKLPLSFFGKKDLADLTSTIMADCSFLETVFSHFIPELVGAIISTFFIAISLLFFNWRMALAALWVLPISFCIVLFSSKVQNKFGRKQMTVKMACADGIQECLESVRDLKSNNAEEKYLEGLDAKIKTVEKRAILTELGTAVFVASAQMVLKLGIATTALVGGRMLSKGNLDVLTFFMFLLVISRMYDPLQAALQNLAAMISANVQTERMREILDHPIQGGASVLSNKGCDIIFNQVGFTYNGKENVLRNASFMAKQGEVTALIGPSGGGKTTLSRLAARFWDIEQGKITIGGMDISKINPETLLSLFSIVFQEVTLFNNTIMENIRIGRKNASDKDVLQAACYAHCDEFAEKLPNKWNTLIGENGSELSGGERQRISIARAFLKDSPIILLDEATASLDVENETLIQSAISQLIKDKTVLVIAHRMRTVANADKIVVLDNGYVVQQGSPKELLQQDGLFKHMVEVQNKAASWTL